MHPRNVARVLALLASLTGARPTLAREPLWRTRPHDPVIVQTSAFTNLIERQAAGLRLYAVRDGQLVPIPFQVDRRDPEGRYHFDAPADVAGPSFDRNDELVFMVKDAGPTLAPGCPPGDAVHEILVRDPVDDTTAAAYLVHDPTGPAASAPPYTYFDAARGELRAQGYQLQYPPGRNFFTRLHLPHHGTGGGATLIERMSMRINPTFSLLLTDWSPELTEDSFRTVIDGVRNGPVRSIVRARQSLDLGRALPEPPAGTMHTFYYASAFITPSTFEIPALALSLLRDFHFEGRSVLGAVGPEARYFDGHHPAGVPLTPSTLPKSGDDHDWYIVDSAGGSYAHLLKIPERWREWGIQRGAILRQDASGRTIAGYTLDNMTRLRAAGSYDLLATIVILPRRYRPGDEDSALAMTRRPLAVTVHPHGRGSAPTATRCPPTASARAGAVAP